MWQAGVLVVATVFVQFSEGGVKNAVDHPLVQRLRRSPQYDNCRYNYPPPPPPPPFWPPPHHHHRHWPPPPPYWPPPPPPPPLPPQQSQQQQSRPVEIEIYSVANSEAKSSAQSAPTANNPAIIPCMTCGDTGQSNAISNAESGTGQAIAVAIAKARASSNSN